MRSIQTGFRVALAVGAGIVGGALVAYTVSQSMLAVDTSVGTQLDRVADEGMELVHLTHAVLQYPGPRSIGQWQGQRTDFGTALGAAPAAGPQAAAVIERARTRLGVLGDVGQKLLDTRARAAAGKPAPEIAGILSAQLFQEATQLQAELKALRAAANGALQHGYEQARARQIGIFLLFLSLGSAFGAYLSLNFRKRVLEPLGNLEDTIDALRRGERARAPVMHDNEIGDIADAFNKLLDHQDASRLEKEQAAAEIFRLNSELEQRVRQRTAQLEAANHDLEAFSYSVSHDLRAPLRALDGYAHAIAEDEAARLSDDGKQMLAHISRNAVKMGQLIDDVLQFSRVTRAEMKSADVDMAALARGVVDGLREHYPAAVATVGELPRAVGDRAMLRQVWENLIGNAFKYSSKAAAPRIEIGSRDIDGRRTYYVADNGAGFDMAHAGKLFEVFHRLHGEREFPGTGAGLAIAKRIVERHSGEIRAEAQVGQGATFFFTLGG